MATFRTCTVCKTEYEATPENFNRSNKVQKDGLTSVCKACKREIDKKFKEQNKEKYRELCKQFKKKNPEKIKEYHKRYREAHRQEILEYARKYYKNNSKRIQENNARTRKPETPEQKKARYEGDRENSRIRTHVYNAKKRSLKATLTKEDWRKCVEYFDHKCAYCGTEANLTKEHFVPVSKGGGFEKGNIIAACKRCNCSKRDKDFSDWYPGQKFYSIEREQKITNYISGENVAIV